MATDNFTQNWPSKLERGQLYFMKLFRMLRLCLLALVAADVHEIEIELRDEMGDRTSKGNDCLCIYS